MKKKYAKLQRIDCNHKITPETDYAFLFQLQNTLLSALREQGILNAVQLHHAEEALKQQRRKQAKQKSEEP